MSTFSTLHLNDGDCDKKKKHFSCFVNVAQISFFRVFVNQCNSSIFTLEGTYHNLNICIFSAVWLHKYHDKMSACLKRASCDISSICRVFCF